MKVTGKVGEKKSGVTDKKKLKADIESIVNSKLNVPPKKKSIVKNIDNSEVGKTKNKKRLKKDKCDDKTLNNDIDDFMKTLDFGEFYDENGCFKGDIFEKEMDDFEKSECSTKDGKKSGKSKTCKDEIPEDQKLKISNKLKFSKSQKDKIPNTSSIMQEISSLTGKSKLKKGNIKVCVKPTEDTSKGSIVSNVKKKKIKQYEENSKTLENKKCLQTKDLKSMSNSKVPAQVKDIKSKNIAVIKSVDSEINTFNSKFNVNLLKQQLKKNGNLPKTTKINKRDKNLNKNITKDKRESTAHDTDTTENLKYEENSNKRIFDVMDMDDEMVIPPRKQSKTEILKEKLKEQLQAGAFRYVNEKLYTQSSAEASEMFKKDKGSFNIYHQGYRTQIKQWPLHPLTIIRRWLITKPRNWVVADFGCGDARLAASIPQKNVKSLDLVAVSSKVIACDMANTPLESESVDVAVFCLSLMGTNLNQFILEANRVLKIKGIMKIAEVESRFDKNLQFAKAVEKMGFRCCYKNIKNKYFWLLDFIKEKNFDDHKKLPDVELKPCLYKKR